jgi:hypothetical protein
VKRQDDAKVHLLAPRFSHAKEVSALFKLVGGKSLGEDVGGVVFAFHIVEIQYSLRIPVTHEVMMDFYMLGMFGVLVILYGI